MSLANYCQALPIALFWLIVMQPFNHFRAEFRCRHRGMHKEILDITIVYTKLFQMSQI
jgi:hypothetical protein